MSALNTVSPKVVAAASGAGAGAVISTLVLWIIGAAAYGVAGDASSVSDAIAAVPTPISGAVLLVLTILGAAIPGYTATDPLRTGAKVDISQHPDVIAYQTASGLQVAGEASPIPTGAPVEVTAEDLDDEPTDEPAPTTDADDEFPEYDGTDAADTEAEPQRALDADGDGKPDVA